MAQIEKETVYLTRYPFLTFEFLKEYFSKTTEMIGKDTLALLVLNYFVELGRNMEQSTVSEYLTDMARGKYLKRKLIGKIRNNFGRKIPQYEYQFNWEYLETHKVLLKIHGNRGTKRGPASQAT